MRKTRTLRRTGRFAGGDAPAGSIAFGVPLAAVFLGVLSLLSDGGLRREAAAASPAAAEEHTPLSGGDIKGSAAGGDNCISCHQAQSTQMLGGLSHPVGVVPTMKVPSQFPLSSGRITCTTCHDPGDASGHATRRAVGKSYLRTDESLASLCSQCHTAETTRKASHANSRLGAHIRSTPAGLASHAPGIDQESRSCMLCHDGSLAGDAGSHAGRLTTFDSKTEHPIGVKYQPRPAGATDEIKLTPLRALDKRVRLFDQQIGCGSCHSVYSSEKKLLVMSNLGSRLCLSCHLQ